MAESYILDWAGDLPTDAPIAIVIHLPAEEASRPGSADLGALIRRFFAARAVSESKAIRDLFHSGRRALAIGLAILGACLFSALQAEGHGPTLRVLGESLVILGWVAVWRPAEIFLYDWLPHARRRRLFRRLAEAEVTLKLAGQAA